LHILSKSVFFSSAKRLRREQTDVASADAKEQIYNYFFAKQAATQQKPETYSAPVVH